MDDLQAAADELNRHYPPGTPVLFWPGARVGPGRTGRLRHPFSVHYTEVVGWVDSYPGFIAATHIHPVSEESALPTESVTAARERDAELARLADDGCRWA